MLYSLEQFSSGHTDIGTAAIWTDALGRYIFMIGGQKYDQSVTSRFFAAVGGQLEPGESWTDCLYREVREEVGCDATILAAASTWLVEADNAVTEIEITDKPAPAILLEMVRTRGPKAGLVYGIAAYLCSISSATFRLQSEEVAGLVAVPGPLLAESTLCPRTSADLLAQGAHAVTPWTGVNPDTLLYPQGTARALAALLSKGLVPSCSTY